MASGRFPGITAIIHLRTGHRCWVRCLALTMSPQSHSPDCSEAIPIGEDRSGFHHYYGDDFKVECPAGSGCYLTLDQVAEELTRRLAGIFLKNASGGRQVNALYPKFQKDQNFRDYIPFYEYFDGDIGHGMGASHQTAWTGVIAKLLQPRAGYSLSGP